MGETLLGPGDLQDADVRWAVHRAMWSESPLKKVRQCRRYPFDRDAEVLPLRVAPREDGGVSVGVGGVKTCGSWGGCVQCGTNIAITRADDLAHAFTIWSALGFGVVLATFTLRHHRKSKLEDLITAQRAGWEAVTSDRPWRRDLAALGVATFDPYAAERAELQAALAVDCSEIEAREIKAQLRKLRRARGVLRAWECTDGDECGWHPHYHCFFLVERQITSEQARVLLQPAWDRWCAGLAELGHTAVADVRGESAGFDVRVLGDDADGANAWARYPFKLALEAVGGVFKNGRETDAKGRPLGSRHRTPFEIMEHLAVAVAQGRGHDDQAEHDRARLREWWITGARLSLRQCPWPPGMRAWFTAKAAELGIPGPLLEEELTDEQAAERDIAGSETAGTFPVAAYGPVVAAELDTLRQAGRQRGVAGVVAWFDRRGIPFELSETGRRWLHGELERPAPGVVVAVGGGADMRRVT